ncbi:MAG TPA: TonB-dependent receptor [Bacteroidales bacterium]|nr:TonB-dependent receptor [Bacteroidales bacterium]
MMKLFKRMFTMLIFLFITVMMYGQGSTTSGINGRVVDEKNQPIPGATVIAIHGPTGTQYGTLVDSNGMFHLPNLNVGGPYSIKVTFIGYKPDIQEKVFLRLGDRLDFSIKMVEDVVQMGEVIVVGKPDNTFNSGRTGANTNITQENMGQMPSIARSLNDFTRLTPQATTTSGGVSLAGSNNRYNNFQIDGAVSNDVFGLSGSGTNGGQAATQPISLDAIQEIQVVIAPFDVRQGGFTGGGINAITKSGTNEITGSAYFFGNNQGLVAKTPTDNPDATRSKLNNYSDYQAGLSVGGPIIKNKLFFFLNAEMTKKEQPSTYDLGDGSNFRQGMLDSILTKLAEIGPGYDAGGYGSFINSTKSTKLFGRLDWNINANHQLTLRHSFLDALDDKLSRSRDYLAFNNAGYRFINKTNSTVAELKSRFNDNIANELRIGYTRVRDYRSLMGDPFPYIKIDKIDGESRSLEIGSERYSSANELDQDIWSIEDNLLWFLGKHNLTIGTHNEFFGFRNLFIRDNMGAYVYSSFNNFMSVGTLAEALPKEYGYSFSNESITGSPRWAPSFNAYQLGLYVQDEWNAAKGLKLTIGLRVDLPVFPDKPTGNTTFNSDPNYTKFGVTTDQMPEAVPMWSPRVGFNWDVTGDRKTQVRGGAGIFTGRLPFVWLSNQFSNTGVEYIRYSFTNPGAFPPGFEFTSDINNQPVGTSALSSEIDVVDPKFKFPQSFRTNLAVDQKLPYGIKGTLESIYTKKMNDIDYRDLTIELSPTFLPGIDNRPVYTKITTPFTNVVYLTNTNKGYSYSITGKLEKDFGFGLNLMAAYTYGMAKDINAGTSSQAFSNWKYNEQYSGANSPELSYSDFDTRHRVIAAVSYKKDYFNSMATSIGLFYSGQTGYNFSYIYYGDVNSDGYYANDLIYIPTDAQIDGMLTNGQFVTSSSITTAPADQASALKEFLADEPYLSTRRGDYAERNGAHVPFVNQLDLRIAQDFYINVNDKRNTLQITFDIMNLGNLLNKDWGRVYSAGFNKTIIDYRGRQGGTSLPTYAFKPQTQDVWSISDFSSRWRGQIGLRYIFN